MPDEGSGAMEKKAIVRQSSASGQCRNGGVASERKYDFAPNRHGRGRRPTSNGGTKAQDVVQNPRPVPINKWDRSVGDRRQRQRNCYDYRQREEVVERDDVLDVLSTGSRKGNANHLLNFKFYPRQSQGDDHRWYDRSCFNSRGRGGYKKTKRYKKEQFLQASCQFVVRDTGDYTEQAINSDALVDWNMIELVRSFSTEPVNCPICLQVPSAGKITKCGHTYCWACILHYLKLGQDDARKCPICYDAVEEDDLKSVQWIDVPNFSVGDEIDMRLMKKAKGSIIALPKYQWEDRQGRPMNIQDGVNTKYMKLLVASCDQIQKEVIEIERVALTVQLDDAEESEACFIHMALEYLKAREQSLKQVFQQRSQTKDKSSIPGLGSTDVYKAQERSSDDNKSHTTATIYADAFEEEIAKVYEDENLDQIDEEPVAVTEEKLENETSDPSTIIESVSTRERNDSECSLPFGSPTCPFPLVPDQEVNSVPLSLEETADHLELPIDLPQAIKQQSKKSNSLNTKDTYFFYQASSGQHIYLSSLNAQCLAKEYGSLEESPNTIKATIVAIERIFMTEDVRKRLRYLDHIPLTCEIHVVELKIKPPVVSKETLKFFEASFDRKRKLRQQKEKEDKRRARKYEMEHKKSFGIYPEVQIPLDNFTQFPSHLSASMGEDIIDDSPPLELPSASSKHHGEEKHTAGPRRLRNDSTTSDESLSGSMSFAQMLKAGKTSTEAGGVWGRAGPSPLNQSGPPPDLVPTTRPRRRDDDDSDGEGLPAPNYCDSMSDAIAKALDGMNLQQSAENTTPQSNSGSGGGRKKRKEKKILFSTSMARKS